MLERDFMRFYRLEKDNLFKKWGYAIFKSLALALVGTVIIMLIAGYKFMIVSSGSMEPTLPVGSLVIVTPCEYEDLREGDIVTMDASGINLTHRIVGKYNGVIGQVVQYLSLKDCYDEDGNVIQSLLDQYNAEEYWVTKGDNSDTVDGKLTRGIVGKVYDEHAFTWLGDVVRYVRANYQMLIVLLVLFGVFITVLEWLKNKMIPDDIECYEYEDDED